MVLGRRRVGEAVTSWGESRRGPKRRTHPVGHPPGSFSQALGTDFLVYWPLFPKGCLPSSLRRSCLSQTAREDSSHR